MPAILPIAALSLGFLVAFMVLYGMQKQSNDWLSPLLAGIVPRRRGLWGVVLSIGALIVKPLTNAAMRVYHSVLHVLTVAASHQMGPVRHWFEGQQAREQLIGHAHASFMNEVALGFGNTTGLVIPRKVAKETRPISRRAKAAWAAAAATAAALARYRHRTDRTINSQIRPELHRATHATVVALPRDIARIRTRQRDIETQLRKPTRRWLRRIAAALWVAYLAGAVVKLLARRFPWLFCRQVKRVGKTVCAVNSDLFESLLSDVAAVAAIISIVTFANELKAFMNTDLPGFAESPLEIITGGISELANLPPGEYL